jgi:hypothetical protein
MYTITHYDQTVLGIKRILRAATEKLFIIYSGSSVRLPSDFSPETMEPEDI